MLLDEVEDAHDATVGEHRAEARFVTEAFGGFVARNVVAASFHCHVTAGHEVPCHPYVAHPARGEKAHESELPTDPRAGFERS